jgi:2,3-dihydroxybiphenyl 1,2-dioxygenase
MTCEIQALGCIGIEVSDLGRWTDFATKILGIEADRRDDGSIDLRLDVYATRIRLIQGSRDDLAFVGWEVKDAETLVRLEARLRASGVAVESLAREAARDRRVAEIIRFTDPEGTVCEAFYGPLQRTDRPSVSPLGVRFKTGRQGLGHIVLSCRDRPAMLAFYRDLLGFRISDFIDTEIVPGRPLQLAFLRCNSRHHSLALAPVPIPKKIVHLMIEVLDIDDIGRALYRCQDAGVHLSMTLGRHSNDEMLSFYAMTPSGFDIEYGWGGLAVDDETWHVVTHEKTSAWGHRFQRPPKPLETPKS